MLAVTALYEQMLHTDFSNFDVEAAVEAWPEAEDQAQEVRQMFGDTDFMSIAVTETMAKHISRRLLRRQLTMLKLKWPEIRERLGKQLIPFAEVSRRLALVGAPTMPRQIGITRTRLRESFHRAVCIRRRFTILDVALRTNMLDTWLDNIFGPGGMWEIGDIQ